MTFFVLDYCRGYLFHNFIDLITDMSNSYQLQLYRLGSPYKQILFEDEFLFVFISSKNLRRNSFSSGYNPMRHLVIERIVFKKFNDCYCLCYNGNSLKIRRTMLLLVQKDLMNIFYILYTVIKN